MRIHFTDLHRTAYILGLIGGLLLLSACSYQSNHSTADVPAPAASTAQTVAASLSGSVHGGRQPISGATVIAYAVSATAGTAATEIASAITDANGNFSISFSPTPANGQIVYLVAVGGNANGSGTNSAIALMSVAGAYCATSGCGFPTSVNIDELSTVASTAALRVFINFTACSNITGDTQPPGDTCVNLPGATPLPSVAGTVNNLVDVSNGEASGFLTSQASGTPAYLTLQKLDSLADILASCVNASGSTSAACTQLFAVALNRPTDTLAASYDIAAWPSVNQTGSALFNLLPPTPIYAPVVSTVPANWSVAGQRFAYVVNNGGNDVSMFKINSLASALTATTGSPYVAGNSMLSVAVDSSGQYVYAVSNADASVYVFDIGSGGALTFNNSFATGSAPTGVVTDPSGAYVYVSNSGSNTISAYSIGSGGTLTPVSGSPFVSGSNPAALAIDPTGHYLYEADSGSNTISAYSIGSNGMLTAIGSAIASGSNPYSLAVDPDGLYVYVANRGGNSVSAYSITQSGSSAGALTPVSGSPFAAGTTPYSLAVDPSGSWVYVANAGSNNVSAFSIGAGGVLTAVSGSPFTSGSSPYTVTVDPAGRYVYTANDGNNSVSVYQLGSTGALTQVAGSPFAAGNQPFGLAADPAGLFLYVTNYTGSVSGYEVGATGVLSGVPGSSCGVGLPANCVAAGNSPYSITEAAGRYVYTANAGSNNISAYTVDPATGVLTQLSGAPFAAGNTPQALAADPAGAYLYVANTAGNNVSGYRVNADGSLATVGGASCGSGFPSNCIAAGTAPAAIGISPNDEYLYVSNHGSNNVSAYTLGSGGALSAVSGSPFPAGTTPAGVVVDPASQYVFVANPGSNNISSYMINGGGAITQNPGSPYSTPGNAPVASCVDPDDSYLYVASERSNSVEAYTIGTGGVLTSYAQLSTNGSAPTSVVATGDYVFIVNYGSDAVTVFASSNGILTPAAPASFATGVNPLDLVYLP